MRSTTLSACLAAALLAGCGKSATVDGQAGTRLTLEKPAAVTIERGGLAKADIRITRRDLDGDVAIRFDKLPGGLEVVDGAQRISGDGAVYTLKAGDSADLVANHVALVTATSPG